MILRILFLMLLWASPGYVCAEAVAHTAPSEEQLDAAQVYKLTNIFTRNVTKWETNGARITVFIRPINSIEHKTFVLQWLNLTNYRYKKLLQQNTYSGVASNVKTIYSDEQMIVIIKTTPNSIGYVGDYMVVNDDSDITFITVD